VASLIAFQRLAGLLPARLQLMANGAAHVNVIDPARLLQWKRFSSFDRKYLQ
jgi:hypothetical protein